MSTIVRVVKAKRMEQPRIHRDPTKTHVHPRHKREGWGGVEVESKPYKGSIFGNRLDVEIPLGEYPENLGFIVVGNWVDHPRFGDSSGQTSLVVEQGPWKGGGTCEIETLNSRYTWIVSGDS